MTSGSNRALALLAMLPLAACILVVPAPSDELSSTCSLTSKEGDTTCGRCIENNCQDQLDECCRAGEACEPILHDLATCAVYETCDEPGRGRVETELRACVARACNTTCNVEQYAVGGSSGTTSSSGRVCRESGAGCVCETEASVESTGPRCPTSLHDEWLCCASTDYPEAGESCACTPLECRDQGPYCLCAVAVDDSAGEPTGACTAPSGTCCLSSSFCDCDDSRDECPATTTPVAACSLSSFDCDEGSNQVDRCSSN